MDLSPLIRAALPLVAVGLIVEARAEQQRAEARKSPARRPADENTIECALVGGSIVPLSEVPR